MTVWQLMSLCRGDLERMAPVLEPTEWRPFTDWCRCFAAHVDGQDRRVLDAVVPHDMALAAMAVCSARFRVVGEQLVACRGRELNPMDLTAAAAFERFGASALEDACEFGSVQP